MICPFFLDIYIYILMILDNKQPSWIGPTVNKNHVNNKGLGGNEFWQPNIVEVEFLAIKLILMGKKNI